MIINFKQIYVLAIEINNIIGSFFFYSHILIFRKKNSKYIGISKVEFQPCKDKEFFLGGSRENVKEKKIEDSKKNKWSDSDRLPINSGL